jgi:hypothetical protein
MQLEVQSGLPTLLAAVERLDTWVFRAAIAVPLACLAVLCAWHLLASLGRMLAGKRRPVRYSPEPPAPETSRDQARVLDGPEDWQQVCAERENALADAYMELAESWLRAHRPLEAAAVWQRVVRVCPDGPQARRARERLRGSRGG